MSKPVFLNLRIDAELRDALTRHFEETGVRTGEFVRRTLKKALLQPAPVERRDVQPVLIPRREASDASRA